MIVELTQRQRDFLRMAKRWIETAKKCSDWFEYECFDYGEEEKADFLAWARRYYSIRIDYAKEKEEAFDALKWKNIVDAHGVNLNTLTSLEAKGYVQIISVPDKEWDGGRVNPTWVKILHF